MTSPCFFTPRGKTVLAAVAAFCACGSSFATTWAFEFGGLVGQESYYHRAGEIFSVTGSFTGTDANADGVLTESELTEATLNGKELLPPTYFDDPHGHPVQATGVRSLTFDVASRQLAVLHAFTMDRAWHGNAFSLSWDSARRSSWSESGGISGSWTYELQPATLRVTEVPEPATVILLLAGLGVMGVAARGRR
jgi:hypothetical protein